MLNLKHLALIFCLFFICHFSFAQLGFSHEIGIVAGPVQFRSDFGVREDSQTNFENSGVGIGLLHYMNFAYSADCNCYTTDTYFNDHFKVRNEISWNRTNLEHAGEFVDPSKTSADANRLRAHTGVAQNLDIGTQLEWFPLSIRSFQSYGYKFAPYLSLGAHFTSYSPKAKTVYNSPDPTVAFGDVFDAGNIYSFWVDDPSATYPINTNGGTTWSVVSSIGVRYKLGPLSDLLLDFRGQYYFNDWVDGLNHKLEYNKHNDWLLWLNFGYIYYLD
ncbi:THC0290_0291 family protein [Changchengzhania lutea]